MKMKKCPIVVEEKVWQYHMDSIHDRFLFYILNVASAEAVS